MEKSALKTQKSDAAKLQQANQEPRKKPIKLWKFRGYKELVPDPYELSL